MSEEKVRHDRAKQRPFSALAVGSFVWILLIFGSLLFFGKDLASLEANEIGDLLAGVFSPLAFVWLAASVRLQNEELSLQREELKETRKAILEQAEHQKKLAEATSDLFEIERNREIREDLRRRRIYKVRSFSGREIDDEKPQR